MTPRNTVRTFHCLNIRLLGIMHKMVGRAPALIFLWLFTVNSLSRSQTLSFLRPFPNSVSLENSTAIAAAGSSAYITGAMRPPSGPGYGFNSDAFLRKYDSSGEQVWERTFGGPVTPAAVKTTNQGIYVAGSTGWNFPAQTYYVLPGQQGKGLSDVFLRRYDLDGKEVWTRQFGGDGADFAFSLAVDSTSVYVAGTLGATIGPGQRFLRKFDLDGNELWTRDSSFVTAVAADGSGVYVTGSIFPSADHKQWSSFVGRYDTEGTLVWTQQFEFEAQVITVSAGGGGVYVSGSETALGGPFLRFLRKYDTSGNVIWTRSFPGQSASTLAIDETAAYVGGTVTQTLPGQCPAGAEDAYVRAFAFDGAELWTRQFGSYYGESANQLAVDAGTVYAAGTQLSAEYYPKVQRTYLAKLVRESAAGDSSTPRIRAECVLNYASYVGGAIAPGEMVTILGSNLGPASTVSFSVDKDGRVPVMLGDTRVLFNGVAAPVLSASASQVVAVVPMAVADQAAADVQVEYKGVRSQAVTLPVLASRSGVFSIDGSGTGQGAAVNQDGTVNSPTNPAQRGSMVALYVTGLGVTDPPLPDGQVVNGVQAKVKAPVSVVLTRDYLDPLGAAGVYYAGGVDGFVQGFTQVNVQIPNDFMGGPWAPQVYLGDAWTSPIASQSAAVVWIR